MEFSLQGHFGYLLVLLVSVGVVVVDLGRFRTQLLVTEFDKSPNFADFNLHHSKFLATMRTRWDCPSRPFSGNNINITRPIASHKRVVI